MTNAELYLQTFNEIEALLKSKMNMDSYVSFKTVVEEMSKSDRTVASFKQDLFQYGDLRNAIVHSKSKKFIAEPSTETVTNIQQIFERIKNPHKLEIFLNQSILKCETDDQIAVILKKMKSGDFSQVPVIKNKSVQGLLTTDTISRWLAYELEKSSILGNRESVSNVMKHAESTNNYLIMKRNDLLINAMEAFVDRFENGTNISAILITENGKSNESILGIITQYDLPRIGRILQGT